MVYSLKDGQNSEEVLPGFLGKETFKWKKKPSLKNRQSDFTDETKDNQIYPRNYSDIKPGTNINIKFITTKVKK